MSEIKQTNFRIDQASADAFRSFCEEKGWNQAQGFDHLLQVLELDQAKSAVSERSLEIADFETHVKAILAAYVQSIALTQNTEARVYDEYARRLESRDETIQSLQEELKAAKKQLEEYAGMEAQLLNAQLELAETRTNMNVLEDQCAKREADKQKIVVMQAEKLAVAEEKAAGYDALKVDRDRLVAELRDATAGAKDQARRYELAAERAAREAEKAMAQAVAEAIAQGSAVASTLRDELQAAKIKAAEDLRTAEEKAHEADKAASAEIRRLEQSLAAAQQELAVLKANKRET